MVRLWYVSHINFLNIAKIIFTSQLYVVKIIEFWYQTKSFVFTRRKYYREFKAWNCDGPKKYEINRFVKHSESTGTVLTASKGSSGHP